LHDINFDISRGSFVGILGKTGSGKSTLIQLLTQQITRSNGSFYINNRPVEEYSLTSFRSKIAYVQQDTFLFSDTIRENILFGGSRSDKDNERLNQAVSYAFLEKDLMELPMGLDTLIGERGVSLSGGQKQRVALARALMKDAELYFLDDCLSAVDAETEAEIIERLKTALQGKTLIMSSHRIAPIIRADEILILENGKIIDRGKHETLVGTNKYYSWLFENQTVSSQ